jgi:antitoxin ParD1/3/4
MDMKVSLTDERDAFVKAKVSSGDYGSASDVVNDALRMMEQAEAARLRVLREAWEEGEVGADRPADFAAIRAKAKRLLKEAGE